MTFTVRIGALAALTVFATGASAQAAADEIPVTFQGEWRHDVAACGSDGDDSILMVRATWFRFWETAGSVQSVTVHSPREITITATMSGEGQVWTDDLRFRLSSERDGLADITEGEAEPFTRRRCPNPPPDDFRIIDPNVEVFTAVAPEDRVEYRGPPIVPNQPPPRRSKDRPEG